MLKRFIPEGRAELITEEIGNTYVGPNDRYVVSLVVGYDEDDAGSPKEALANALSLTRDENSYDTHWYVHDRVTGITRQFEQRDGEEDDYEDICDTPGCENSLTDGEGFDGYCGSCADKREAEGLYGE